MISAISIALLLLTTKLNPASPSTPTTHFATHQGIIINEDAELTEVRKAFTAGNYQRAIEVLKSYVEKKPDRVEGYYYLGLSHSALRQNDESIAALEKAVAIKPQMAVMHFELGQSYLAAKNYEAAVKQYQWLSETEKELAVEFRWAIPATVAQQYQLPPSTLEVPQEDLDAAGSIQQSAKDARPKITYKEKAKYTEEARSHRVAGAVILTTVLSKQGKLIVTGVVRALPYGLTETAIEAARKVRFDPALKDGQPVSVRSTLEFTFRLY